MAIVVHSPFSGAPVKVREADIGRAVRDADGRFFYVLQTSDGSGYYGSPTRIANAADEQRVAALAAAYEAGGADAGATGDAGGAVGGSSATAGRAEPHDATGRRRPVSIVRLLLIVILAAALGAGAWFGVVYWLDARARQSSSDDAASTSMNELSQPHMNGLALVADDKAG